MSQILIDKQICTLCGECKNVCPFGAIDIDSNKKNIEINSACKVCKLCIKKCPHNAMSLEKVEVKGVNKDEYKGILVYAENINGEIHPVTIELIGKAKELSKDTDNKVMCLIAGENIKNTAVELLKYGVEKVFLYDNEKLKDFTVGTYTNVFEDCINNNKPSIVLVGATPMGRSLAPSVSTRFKTGLTADCTKLELKENGDLVQIRPAFGGNIMAQIITPNHRPQFATVRYKVMNPAPIVENPTGKVVACSCDNILFNENVEIIKVSHKEKKLDISDAEVIVVAGRGVKKPSDLALLEDFANEINGQLAVTRPLVEAGFAPYTKQIGLSGRTVKPKLIILCGVSGAVQFTAAMNSAEYIFAINTDKNAPIFKIAHYGIVGDLYKIIPTLTEKLKRGRE